MKTVAKPDIADIYAAKKDELNMIILALPVRGCFVKYPSFLNDIFENSGESEENPEYISNIGLFKLYIAIMYYILLNRNKYSEVDINFKKMQKSKEIFAYERGGDENYDLTVQVLNIYETFFYNCLEFEDDKRKYTALVSIKCDLDEKDIEKIDEIEENQKKLISQLEKCNLY
jgi:hypothetical protein